ncbi:MAG: DUF748 domain-containing protein [Planctomycetota bacterium]
MTQADDSQPKSSAGSSPEDVVTPQETTVEEAPQRPADSADAAKKPPRSRRQKWLRRTLWCVGVLLVLRVALAIALPMIIDSALSHYGLACEYESLDVSLLGADTELWHFRLTTADGKTVYADTEYCRADLSVLDLFRGRVVARRLECDGVDLFLERNAAGELTLLRHFQSSGVPAPVPPAAPASETPEPIRIAAPLEISALRLQHAQVHFVDGSIDPPQRVRLDCHIRLSDFAHEERPTRFGVELAAPGVLPRLVLEGTSRLDDEQLQMDFEARLDALAIGSLDPYLNASGLGLRTRQVSGGFRGTLHVTTNPLSRATLEIVDVDLLSAGAQPVRLDTLTAVVGFAIDATPVIERVEVRGGEVTVQRHASGNWSCAGLELTGGSGTPAVVAGPQPLAPVPPARVPVAPLTPLVGLERFAITDCEVRVVDAFVGDAPPVGVRLDELAIARTAEPAAGQSHSLVMNGAMAGVAARVAVTGQCELLPSSVSFSFDATATDYETEGLAAYLQGSGLELDLAGGASTCTVSGDAAFGDQVEVALSVEMAHAVAASSRTSSAPGASARGKLQVSGVRVDPVSRRLDVERVELRRLAGDLLRDADGAWRLPGVTYRGQTGAGAKDPGASDPATATATAAAAPANAATPQDPDPAAPLRASSAGVPWEVHVGSIVVDGTGARFDDKMTADVPFVCARLGLEARELTLGAGYPNRSGTVHAYCEVPGLFGAIDFEAEVNHRNASSWLTGSLRATNLSTARLVPYLPPDLLVSGWESASAQCDVDLDLHVGDPRRSTPSSSNLLAIDLALRDLALHDGDATPFQCDRVDLQAGVATDGAVRVDELTIAAPVMTVQRDETTLAALGLRLNVAPNATAAVETTNPPLPPSSPLDIALPTLPDLRVSVGVIALQGGELRWDDATFGLAGTIVADGALTDLDTTSQRPARLSGRLRSDRFVERVTVEGTVVVRGDLQEVTLTGRLAGVDGAELNQVLPSGTSVEMQRGELAATLHAQLQPHATGGHEALVALRDVSVMDRELSPDALLAMAEATCRVGRWDPAAEVYEIAQVSSSGVRGHATKDASGAVHVAGFVIAPPDESAAAPSTIETVPQRRPRPATSGQGGPQRQPRFTIQKVDLQLDEFRWQEAAGEEALVIKEWSLQTRTPWTADLSADGEPPALVLEVRGAADPLVAAVATDLTLAPFASEPTLELDCRVRGIHGERLAKVLPQAAVDLAPLGVGEFQMLVGARWTSPRRGPLDWNVQRGIAADVRVDDVRLTNEHGVVVAGVKQVLVDGINVDVAKRRMAISSVEVDTPRGRVLRDASSLQVAGVRLATAAPDEGVPASEGVTDEVEQAVEAPAIVSMSEAAPWHVVVEQLAVSGIDLEVDDRTGEQPCLLPFRALGLGVQNIEIGADNPRPTRFDLMLESGPGIDPARPWLTELAATGQLTLGEKVSGRVRTQIGALDLLSLGEIAAAAGVTIGGGVFDGRVDLRFEDDGGMTVDSEFLLTDLDLQEPENGPIESYLKLPLSLQPAIFLLRDDAGTIRVPVAASLDAEGISLAKLTTVLAATTAQVVADAIASSPFRVVGTVTDIAGLTGDEEGVAPVEKALLCGGGDVRLLGDASGVIATLATQLAADPQLQLTLRHEVGVADVEVLRTRVTPSERERVELLARLRGRRGVLRDERVALARAACDATLVSAGALARGARRDVQRVDNALGEIEQAIDRLVDAGDDPPPHRVARRVRECSIELARERLTAVQRQFEKLGVATEQIRVVAPRSNADPEHPQGRLELTVRRVAAAG